MSMLSNFNDPTIDVVVALRNDQFKLTCKYKRMIDVIPHSFFYFLHFISAYPRIPRVAK